MSVVVLFLVLVGNPKEKNVSVVVLLVLIVLVVLFLVLIGNPKEKMCLWLSFLSLSLC